MLIFLLESVNLDHCLLFRVDLLTIETVNDFTNFHPFISSLAWKYKCEVVVRQREQKVIVCVLFEIKYQMFDISLTIFCNCMLFV